MYTPLNYDQINAVAGHYSPALVKSYNNLQFNYWERALYQRIASVIKVEGLPEEWTGSRRDFFFYCLYRFGYVGIFKTPEFGLSFQPCTLSGYDFYYQPKRILVSNPLLSRQFEIGESCELLKLTPDFRGVFDIIVYFAEKLASLDGAISQSIINSRFAYLIAAKNKSAAEAAKLIFDKINAGEPMAVFDKSMLLPDDPNSADSSPIQFIERTMTDKAYLTTDQLADMQTILNNFDAEIGIPSVPYQKKERLVTDEANMRQADSTARAKTWIDCLNDSAARINKMFGTSLNFYLTFDEVEEMSLEDMEVVTDAG